MPDQSTQAPFSSFLVTLQDTTGVQTTLGGFAQAEGIPRKLQGLHKFTNITLKRGYVSSSALNNWMNSVRSGLPTPRRQVVLVQRDQTGKGVSAWQLVNAYPVKYQGPVLHSGSSDVAIEELILASEGVELIPSK